MKKRLFAAFLMVGAISAVMVMSASAFWTTRTATADVQATAGEANLTIAGCDVSNGCSTSIQFDDIYPNWSSTPHSASIVNSGDVPLTVVLELDGWSDDAELWSALKLDVDCGSGSVWSGNLLAYDAGVSLFSLNPNENRSCTAQLSLPDNGANQDDLQGKSAGFTVNIYGKTN